MNISNKSIRNESLLQMNNDKIDFSPIHVKKKLNSARSLTQTKNEKKSIDTCIKNVNDKNNDNNQKPLTARENSNNQMSYLKRRQEYLKKRSLPSILNSKGFINNEQNNQDQNLKEDNRNDINDILSYSPPESKKYNKKKTIKINGFFTDDKKSLSTQNTNTNILYHHNNNHLSQRSWRTILNFEKVHHTKYSIQESPKFLTTRNGFNSSHGPGVTLRKYSQTSREVKNLLTTFNKHISTSTTNNIPNHFKSVPTTAGPTVENLETLDEINQLSKSKNRFLKRSRYSCKQINVPQKSKDKLNFFVNHIDPEMFIDDMKETSFQNAEDNNNKHENSYSGKRFDTIMQEYQKKSEQGIMLSNETDLISNKNKPTNKKKESELKSNNELMKGYSHKLKEFSLLPNDNLTIIKRSKTQCSNNYQNMTDDQEKSKQLNKANLLSPKRVEIRIMNISNMNKPKDKELDFIQNVSKKTLEAYAEQFIDYSKVPETTLRNRFKNIRRKLGEMLWKLNSLNITLREFLEKKIFSSKPFERKFSKAFITASKEGDTLMLSKLLKIDRYLVYDFDYIGQTALHWACKRELFDTVQFLIRAHCDVDAQDMAGRPPLYFAMRSSNSSIVKLLLYSKANPWGIKDIDFKTLTDDFKCNWFLQKARQLRILISFKQPKDRHNIWQIEAEKFFVDPSEYPDQIKNVKFANT